MSDQLNGFDDHSDWGVERQWAYAVSCHQAPKRAKRIGGLRSHDPSPLARLLRGDTPLPREVRDYIADVLVERGPKKRGAPPVRSGSEDRQLLDAVVLRRALTRATKNAYTSERCETEAMKEVARELGPLLRRDLKAKSALSVLRKLVQDNRQYVDNTPVRQSLQKEIDEAIKDHLERLQQASGKASNAE